MGAHVSAWPQGVYSHRDVSLPGRTVRRRRVFLGHAGAASISIACWIASALFFLWGVYSLPGGMTYNAAYDDITYLYRPDKAFRRALAGGAAYGWAWLITICAMSLSFLGLLGLGIGFFYTSVWAWSVGLCVLPRARPRRSRAKAVMTLRFERAFDVPPDVAWRFLTVPAQINLWSEAKVTALGSGDNVAGARRRVVVRACGLSLVLEEESVEVIRPARFAYRVLSGGGLRHHSGVIVLTPNRAGTDVVWEVTFESVVPGVAPILAVVLRRQLGRSLDALRRLLSEAAARHSGPEAV